MRKVFAAKISATHVDIFEVSQQLLQDSFFLFMVFLGLGLILIELCLAEQSKAA